MSNGNLEEIAKEVWEFGKNLGLVEKGEGKKIIEHLTVLELRDKEAQVVNVLRRRTRHFNKVCWPGGTSELCACAIGNLQCKGIGGRAKKWEVQQLVREQNLDMICIQESKAKNVDRVFCAALWGDGDFGWCFKASDDRSGGLIILWRKDIFTLVDSYSVNNFLGVSG